MLIEKPGDNIMICDCGGGTVDLTTYSIAATEPVLDFEELVVGTGLSSTPSRDP